MQRPLGRDAGRVVDEYMREQNLWAAEFIATPGRRPDIAMAPDPRTQTSPLSARPNLYLVVIRGQEASLFNVNLVLGEGRRGPSVLAHLSVRADLMMNEQAPAGLETIPAAPIEWSQAARESLAAAVREGPGPAPLGPVARSFVLDPVTHEPADVLLGDALRSWARAGYDVVAALPDMVVAAAFFGARQESAPATVRGFLGPLFAHDLLELSLDSNWAVLAPSLNDQVKVSNLNRRVLRDLTESIDRHGATIDALAAFMWRSRDDDPTLGLALGSLLDTQVMLKAGGSGSLDALLLYGSLSRRQRSALESGQALAVGSLTPAQREVVRRIAYSDEIRLHAPGPVGLAGLMVEPTSAFPHGLPVTGTLSLLIHREESLTAHLRLADGSWQTAGPVSTHSIGWLLARQAAGVARDRAGGFPDGFTLAGRERLEFRVHFDAEHWQAVELTRLLPAAGVPVPWTELPEQVRRAIEQSRAQAEAQQAGGRTGTGPP